ncbi:MAG: hypothetical protein IH612_19020 [Desulfofustis sp.]|nr:hypothetical protein [Desulfofustis sp.]
MNYQNSLNIARPVFHPGFVQRFNRRRAFELPGGAMLWLAAAKVSVAAIGVALIVNLWLGHAASTVREDIAAISERQQILNNEQIALLAERASLMSEQQIQREAGSRLALFVPEQDQVLKLR